MKRKKLEQTFDWISFGLKGIFAIDWIRSRTFFKDCKTQNNMKKATILVAVLIVLLSVKCTSDRKKSESTPPKYTADYE